MTAKLSSTSTSLVIAHGFAISILYIMVKAFLSFTSITDAMAFYGVYHRDPVNQLIHFFGVPAIIWSLMVFFSHLRVGSPFATLINIPFTKVHSMNYSTIATLIYVFFYLYLDLFGGVLYAPFAYLMYSTANNMMIGDQLKAMKDHKMKDSTSGNANGKPGKISWVGTGKLLKVAGLLHFFGWYVQIHPGHGIYEGATPAAANNLGAALTSAPLFAYYEGLWFVGLNKQLQDQTKVLVDEYSIKLCKDGFNMRACGDYDLN